MTPEDDDTPADVLARFLDDNGCGYTTRLLDVILAHTREAVLAERV